jgi:hypothetical protein
LIIMTTKIAALFLMMAMTAVASEPARGPVAEPAQDSDIEGSTELSMNPVTYTNEGGDFQIVFPSGCGKLVTRSNEPDLFGGEQWDEIIQVNHVFCDRYQENGEGCSVTATFNLHSEDGSMAGPQHVIIRVQEILAEYGAKVISQDVIKKEYDNGIFIEGVEVKAKPDMGKGEVWVRGLIVEGDIYILTAWNIEGGVWENSDYITFFNSFQPWTD